ncbi:MAG: type II toxin-antitoxin system VapC family toxin [Candidatus Helarchaeota archaeon]|nr:type II toxin-antitoxin system VapC family toxin [Candidatus Helarchaeota archaeon]
MWLLDTNALITCHKFSNMKLIKKKYTFTTIFCIMEFPIAAKYKEILVYYPSAINYREGLKYAIKLRKNGIPIPAIDILIGTIAVDKNIHLVTDDVHFKLFNIV